MKIHVFGKNHRKGIAKNTGKPYDFWEIHYSGPRRNVTGEAAIIKTADPSLFDFEAMAVPGDYMLECDDQGNIFNFAAVTTSGITPGKQ